jgi:hypothetical protein
MVIEAKGWPLLFVNGWRSSCINFFLCPAQVLIRSWTFSGDYTDDCTAICRNSGLPYIANKTHAMCDCAVSNRVKYRLMFA